MLKKFFIAALIGCFVLSSSGAQTVNAPKLHCVSVFPLTTYILLAWSPPVNVCGPFNGYLIYRSLDFNGPYTLIYTENNQAATSYVDSLSNGNTETYYYYMVSDYDCPGGTFLHSDTLENPGPVFPSINYVTVNNNNAEINWKPSVSPETYAYIIYKEKLANIPYDTVYGRFNTSYTDVNATVNDDTVSYKIASMDSCLNTGLINDSAQRTIYLSQTVDRCTQTISLNWSVYYNWQFPVQQYDVYVSVNGGPSTLIKTLPPDSLIYNASGFSDGDSICFTVVATESQLLYTSASNTACTKLNVVEPARDLYIRNVTVGAPNRVDVYYSMDSLADLLSIKIERGLDSVYFSALATISPPADLSIINVFPDSTALPSQLSYYYRIIATDSCNKRDTSSIGKSVLLTGYAFSDLSFLIRWDESFMQHGMVTAYDLYRDDGNGFNKVTSFPDNIFEYDESSIPTTTPCYYIEAADSMQFPNGLTDTIHSRSNILCLNQPSQIYIPNAFAPQGKNNIFKPILNIPLITSYNFSVYNRWGEKIFTTEDQDEGWDGRYNGNIVQQGAYAYQVVVVDDQKKKIEAKGTVLVVR